MIALGIFAFTLGGRPERIGAGAYILGWIITVALGYAADVVGVQWGTFGVDVIVLAAFGALVWKAPRSWPVWACALQLVAVASHIMLVVKLPTPVSAFYTVLNLTSYGILIAIALGTFFAWQTRKAVGDAYVE